MKKQLRRVSPSAHVRRTMTQALWKGVNAISVVSLVFSTSFAGILTSPQTLHAGEITGVNLSGTKFNDLNGNGTWDAGEPGLPGWTIQLLGPCLFTALDYTDVTGGAPDGQLTVADASVFTNYFLTNDPHADVNGDGIVNTADQDCATDGYGDGVLTSSPSGILQTQVTNAAGDYNFSQLPAGTYWLSEVAQAGWTQTTAPTIYGPFTVSGASNNFGNFHAASISGMKFNDVNGNGVKDEGDTGLPDWTIQLWAQCSVSRADYNDDGQITLADAVLFTTPYANHDSSADIHADSMVNVLDYDCMKALENQTPPDGDWYVIRTTLTNGSGNYYFADVPAGDYRVSEEQKAGWTKTLPSSAFYSLALVSNDDITNKDFGNTQPQRGPSLTIAKTDNRDTANPQDTLHYVITVTNSGNSAANNVQVVDTLPTHVASVSNISSPGLQSGNLIFWNNLTIDANSSLQLSLDATLDNNFPIGSTTLTNSADLGSNNQFDLPVTASAPQAAAVFSGIAEDTTIVTVAPAAAALTISKTDNQTTAKSGQVLHYAITVNNATDTAATNVKVTDTLPSFISLVNNISDGGNQFGTAINWQNLTVPAHGNRVLTYDATIDANLDVGSYILHNMATLGCGSPISAITVAPCPYNGTTADDTNVTVSATKTTTLSPAPALTIQKSANVVVANPGNTISYTVKVSNNGTDAAKDVTLNDVLPTGFTTLDSGANKLVINLGTIAAGTSVSTTYQTVTDSTLTDGSYTNTATITASNAPAISAQADVILRTPAVLGAETPGPQPKVLGAETTLPATGTGVTDYMIALFGIIALAVGIRLTRQSIKE